MAEIDKPQVINPPNTLKTKVKIGGPGAVSPEILERAEAVIANLTENYLEWVKEDFSKITAVFEDLKAGRGNEAEVLDRIFQIAHDMKGQGGSFGYDLITVVGDKLCRLVEKMKGPLGDADKEVIRLHIDAMRVIIGQRIEGDGGPIGEKLIKGLELVTVKVAK